jgi:hypothetical protein
MNMFCEEDAISLFTIKLLCHKRMRDPTMFNFLLTDSCCLNNRQFHVGGCNLSTFAPRSVTAVAHSIENVHDLFELVMPVISHEL